MPHFKPYSYEQMLMIPVDLKNQLQPGTFEFALNKIVDEMDLSVFDGRFCNDETGAPAYDPAILLKIVLEVRLKKRTGRIEAALLRSFFYRLVRH